MAFQVKTSNWVNSFLCIYKINYRWMSALASKRGENTRRLIQYDVYELLDVGNKLTIDFEKAGQKRVLDSFVERH